MICAANQKIIMKLYLNYTNVRHDDGYVDEYVELASTPVAPSEKVLDDKIISTYAIKWHSSACSGAAIRRALKARDAELLRCYGGCGRLSGDLHALAFGA